MKKTTIVVKLKIDRIRNGGLTRTSEVVKQTHTLRSSNAKLLIQSFERDPKAEIISIEEGEE